MTADQWEGFSGAGDAPDSYGLRYRQKGANSWIATLSIGGDANSHTLSGLTNGQIYEAEMWRVDDGVDGPAQKVDFKPTATAVAPAKPDVAASGRARSIQVHATIHEEDERAPITSWRYKTATTQAGLSSAAWKTVPSSADPDVTFNIPGLMATTTYYLQVQAVNSVGNGAASDVVTEATEGGVSTGSWVQTAWSTSTYDQNLDSVPKNTLTLYGATDNFSPINAPPFGQATAFAKGVVLYFDDGPLKEVQLSSRLQTFAGPNFYWNAFIRTRTRESGNGRVGVVVIVEHNHPRGVPGVGRDRSALQAGLHHHPQHGGQRADAGEDGHAGPALRDEEHTGRERQHDGAAHQAGTLRRAQLRQDDGCHVCRARGPRHTRPDGHGPHLRSERGSVGHHRGRQRQPSVRVGDALRVHHRGSVVG